MKHEHYLSTACIHGDEIVTPDGRTGHAYCQGDTGAAGTKIPAQCKFCDPPLLCACPCHKESTVRHWTDFTPEQAVDIDLTEPPYLDIVAPLNEAGERCPWPWDPEQLKGAPIGQYHCRHCGAMVLAGIPHIDYGDDGPDPDNRIKDGN